jgi:hypothetical protein
MIQDLYITYVYDFKYIDSQETTIISRQYTHLISKETIPYEKW